MKKWYESKTLWAGVVEVLIGALGLLATWIEVGDYTLPSIILLVVGLLKIAFRLLTVMPIDTPLV